MNREPKITFKTYIISGLMLSKVQGKFCKEASKPLESPTLESVDKFSVSEY